MKFVRREFSTSVIHRSDSVQRPGLSSIDVLGKTKLPQARPCCCAIAFLIAVFGSISGSHVLASDHADPMGFPKPDPESGLTGLFVFESGDNLILVLGARAGLVDDDVNLHPFRFQIRMDVDSAVNYAYQDVNDRYGGLVTDSRSIKEDITFEFCFDQFARNDNPFDNTNEDGSIALEPIVKGLEANDVRSWIGIRDDPFILYRFAKTNVVAMVVEVPFSSLPEKSDPILVWGTSHRHGQQIDHVGRSLRTMLPRFEFFNTLHPSEHVDEIKKRESEPGVLQDVLATYVSPLFGIRHYDFQPDVVIFSRERWIKTKEQYHAGEDVDINSSVVAFPNGRRLTDDIAKLMCIQGDCLLYEVSVADAAADDQERPTDPGVYSGGDRDGEKIQFISALPYLAPPHETPIAMERPKLKARTLVIAFLLVVLFLAFLLLPWVLWWKVKKRLNHLRSSLAKK